MKTLFVPLMSFAVMALIPAAASALGAGAVARSVQETYAAFRDLTASFRQESRVATLGRSRVREGTIRFKKPGLMRWDYDPPDPQLLVSDGEKLWYYRENSNQVILRELSRAFTSQTPLLFLFGEGDLSKEFHWDEGELAANSDGRFILEMRPRRESPDLVALTLEVRSADFTIAATVLEDAFGNVTRLEFSGEQENRGLSASLFTFEVPPGAEVVRP